ncbi:MAG: lamin tail domain-containing protein, partial [Acidimicrobiia bacterium]|nr:lamin tail domain-containing protein [Acidimicrobiia bacterium]
ALACGAACVYDESACTDHPLPMAGDVVITEIMQDPDVVPDLDGEWFEVYNATGIDLQLLGCEVEGSGSEVFAIDVDLPIGPAEYRIFATDSGVDQGFVPDFQWAEVDFGLSNDSDIVRLVCDGTLVDEVIYDDGATFPDPTGKCMSLDIGSFDAVANDLGANWCAGSTSYNGDFGTPGAENPVCMAGAVPTDLFFSEYVEGSSNNKALEIYNASGVAVDLGDCAIQMYFGGVVPPNTIILLGGIVPPDDVFVVCDVDIDPMAAPACDVLSPWSFFNGDDTIELVCDGTVFDVIGQIGFDPGTEWSMGGVGTANETIRRHCDVTMGDANGFDPFDPSAEWDSFPQDTFDDLGQYVCPSCATVIDEPGADLCTPAYPDNFVPFSAVYDGFPAGCGGPGTTIGIGYAAFPYVTYLSSPTSVQAGDQISVSYTGWAAGSTGSIEVEASVSPDGSSWSSCGIAPGRNFLGNGTLDTIVCDSPFAAAELYVRLETVGLSSALVYIRDTFVEICA